MATRTIEVEGLIREFKKGPRAVDEVNLFVGDGEIYGFLGPNGAGKTTTVRMLTTLLPPSGGKALVGGYDVRREGPQVRSVIGAALQEVALDPLLTGRESIRLQAGLHGFSRSEGRQRGERLLERVGLSSAADRKVGTYSGGMKRRLDLALALVHGPSIVFLDEPTTGLDPQSRAALWDEVRRLAKQEGVTIFLTTQYLEEADVLADRVGIINSGRIVAEGTPAELKAEIGRQTVEVTVQNAADRGRVESVLARFGELTAPAGSDGIGVRLHEDSAALADIIRSLDSAGIAIAHLEVNEPTLDDVFLSKTGRSLEGGDEEAEAEQAEEGVPERAPERPEDELRLAAAARSQVERPGTVVRQLLTGHLPGSQPPPAPTRSALAFRSGPLAGQTIAVDTMLTLGREGVDVTIEDPEMSRRHAVVRVVEGSLVIEDTGSLNGTWVNGKRIETATLLTPGDTVALGKTVLEVHAAAGQPASGVPA